MGRAAHSRRTAHYTNIVNLLDLCAIAVPSAFTTNGLPVGATLIAPAFCDQGVIVSGQTYWRRRNIRGALSLRRDKKTKATLLMPCGCWKISFGNRSARSGVKFRCGSEFARLSAFKIALSRRVRRNSLLISLLAGKSGSGDRFDFDCVRHHAVPAISDYGDFA